MFYITLFLVNFGYIFRWMNLFIIRYFTLQSGHETEKWFWSFYLQSFIIQKYMTIFIEFCVMCAIIEIIHYLFLSVFIIIYIQHNYKRFKCDIQMNFKVFHERKYKIIKLNINKLNHLKTLQNFLGPLRLYNYLYIHQLITDRRIAIWEIYLNQGHHFKVLNYVESS